MFSAIQQFLTALHGVKVSTGLLLTFAFAAVLIVDRAGWYPLAAAASWAPAAAFAAFALSLALTTARAFQDVTTARRQQQRNSLRFSRVEARLTPQMAPPLPLHPRPPPAYGLVIQCVCSTETGTAKLMQGRVISPKIQSATPVQILGTDLHDGLNEHEPKIVGGTVWQLTIATLLTPKVDFTMGQHVPLHIALIDELGRSHELKTTALVA